MDLSEEYSQWQSHTHGHNFTFNFAQENLSNSQMTNSQIPFKTRKSQKLLGDV